MIDTNVLLVANGKHEGISLECQRECIQQLIAAKRKITVLDDNYLILGEYLTKLKPNQPKGPGDVFLKWLLQNSNNTKRVEKVSITESDNAMFFKFPDKELQSQIDPADRKFVAVAYVHPKHPSILQATDCKWLNWWEKLVAHNITVNFLCPNDICKFYSEKFPNQKMPAMPENRVHCHTQQCSFPMNSGS